MRPKTHIALLCLAFSSASADAGLVAPGETVSLNSGDFVTPAGTLLAEKTSAFAIDYGADPDVGFDGKLNGTLYSAVYDVGGKLAFLYDVDLNADNLIDGAIEQSELAVQAFAGFKTDVSGRLEYEEQFQASRSTDASQIMVYSDSPGLGGPPTVLIQTEATAFDPNGKAVFFAGDELLTLNATRSVSGSATIESVFQPTILGPGSEEPPTAIPLPPAAYSGLGVLTAIGAILFVRRRWGGEALA